MKDKLLLEDPDREVEFQFATYQAIENMQTEFEFYGYVVELSAAIDAVNDIVSRRTYH